MNQSRPRRTDPDGTFVCLSPCPRLPPQCYFTCPGHPRTHRVFRAAFTERIAVFTSYGGEGRQIGVFDDARIESLANQAAKATPGIAKARHRYPAQLLTLIAAQLAILNASQPLATGGMAQAATTARDAALELLRAANDRVRFFYYLVTDNEDYTPELAGTSAGTTVSVAGSGPLTPGGPASCGWWGPTSRVTARRVIT